MYDNKIFPPNQSNNEEKNKQQNVYKTTILKQKELNSTIKQEKTETIKKDIQKK